MNFYKKLEDNLSSFINSFTQIQDPYEIQNGIYGGTFHKDGESLYFRMELLTKANSSYWGIYKRNSTSIANGHSNGLLSGLVSQVGTNSYLNNERFATLTGFTPKEASAFTNKADLLISTVITLH